MERRHDVTNSTATEATIYLYDSIDPFYGVNAADFVKELNGLKAKTIHLRINSPGGDVFDARAIATAVAQHSSHIIAHIDGLAASAASYIAIAADEVEMAEGAFLMIHNAWTFALGNADDLRSTADLLEKIDGTLAADYAKKTGKALATVTDWMSAETWFTAEEAVTYGFATRVAETPAKESVAAAWDLSIFDNAPKFAPALVEEPSFDAAAALEEARLRDEEIAALMHFDDAKRRFALLENVA